MSEKLCALRKIGGGMSGKIKEVLILIHPDGNAPMFGAIVNCTTEQIYMDCFMNGSGKGAAMSNYSEFVNVYWQSVTFKKDCRWLPIGLTAGTGLVDSNNIVSKVTGNSFTIDTTARKLQVYGILDP